MKKKMMIALTSLALLGGCSGGEEKARAERAAAEKAEAARVAAIARTHVKVTPAVPDAVKGEDRAKMQAALIETMADSPDVSSEEYEGEAYRRNVKLTADQIARKKAAYKPQKAAGASSSPVGAPAAAK